jgi:hypothetical protein
VAYKADTHQQLEIKHYFYWFLQMQAEKSISFPVIEKNSSIDKLFIVNDQQFFSIYRFFKHNFGFNPRTNKAETAGMFRVTI